MPEPHPSLSFRHTNERSLRDLGRRKSMVTSRSLGGRAAFMRHDSATALFFPCAVKVTRTRGCCCDESLLIFVLERSGTTIISVLASSG
jgi:hypothetical protein